MKIVVWKNGSDWRFEVVANFRCEAESDLLPIGLKCSFITTTMIAWPVADLGPVQELSRWRDQKPAWLALNSIWLNNFTPSSATRNEINVPSSAHQSSMENIASADRSIHWSLKRGLFCPRRRKTHSERQMPSDNWAQMKWSSPIADNCPPRGLRRLISSATRSS